MCVLAHFLEVLHFSLFLSLSRVCVLVHFFKMNPVPLWTDYLNMIMITASDSCHNKVMRRRRHTNILWSIHFDISWHWPLPPPPLGIVHWSGKWPELLQSGWSYWRTVSHRTVLPTFENNFLASTDRQLFFKNVLLLLFEIFSLFFWLALNIYYFFAFVFLSVNQNSLWK